MKKFLTILSLILMPLRLRQVRWQTDTVKFGHLPYLNTEEYL